MKSDNRERKLEGDVLSQTAPLDVRRPVDETQSARQGATAPQPKIGADDEAEAVSATDLDDAWASLTSALRSADEDFDSAAAYARLFRTLPRELVAMPLAEPVSVRNRRDSGPEIRDLALGLIAMGAVCAGLAGLAVFGPGYERRTAPQQQVAQSASAAPRSGASSAGASSADASSADASSARGGEAWNDDRWEEEMLALADELHAERSRIVRFDRRPLGRPDEGLRRLERNFAQTRHSFGPPAGF